MICNMLIYREIYVFSLASLTREILAKFVIHKNLQITVTDGADTQKKSVAAATAQRMPSMAEETMPPE